MALVRAYDNIIIIINNNNYYYFYYYLLLLLLIEKIKILLFNSRGKLPHYSLQGHELEIVEEVNKVNKLYPTVLIVG